MQKGSAIRVNLHDNIPDEYNAGIGRGGKGGQGWPADKPTAFSSVEKIRLKPPSETGLELRIVIGTLRSTELVTSLHSLHNAVLC
jgi:hypothetical protein